VGKAARARVRIGTSFNVAFGPSAWSTSRTRNDVQRCVTLGCSPEKGQPLVLPYRGGEWVTARRAALGAGGCGGQSGEVVAAALALAAAEMATAAPPEPGGWYCYQGEGAQMRDVGAGHDGAARGSGVKRAKVYHSRARRPGIAGWGRCRRGAGGCQVLRCGRARTRSTRCGLSVCQKG
jgi:hypothetical protein